MERHHSGCRPPTSDHVSTCGSMGPRYHEGATSPQVPDPPPNGTAPAVATVTQHWRTNAVTPDWFPEIARASRSCYFGGGRYHGRRRLPPLIRTGAIPGNVEVWRGPGM